MQALFEKSLKKFFATFLPFLEADFAVENRKTGRGKEEKGNPGYVWKKKHGFPHFMQFAN